MIKKPNNVTFQLSYDFNSNRGSLKKLAEEAFESIFPLRRSLVSKGNRETLNFLSKKFSIIHKDTFLFESGSNLNGWTVPNAWDLLDFQLKTVSGEILFNLDDTNLRVVRGSSSFSGKMKIRDLVQHIYTHPRNKDAIPFVTNYYGDFDWGICLSENEKQYLIESYKELFVEIKVDQSPGNLDLDVFEYGSISKENVRKVLFWTYICHPQMAQNELSGPLVFFTLSNILQKIQNKGFKFKNKYVFGISSETLGALAFIQKKRSQLASFIGCHVLTCLGLANHKFVLQKSLKENTFPERVLKSVLKDNVGNSITEHNYFKRGSDERQFCWPNVNIDTSYFCRGKYHEYSEYHTNLDDHLDFDALIKSVELYFKAIHIYESNAIPVSKNLGEPMLSKMGLWSEFNIGGRLPERYRFTDFLVLCNGSRDLLTISELLDWPYDVVSDFYRKAKEVRLVEVEDEC